MLCSLPFYKLVVPTVDTVRYTYLVSCLVSNCYPVMLVGPVGTGKTSVAQGVLSKLDPAAYSVLTINLSAQVCQLLLPDHFSTSSLRSFFCYRLEQSTIRTHIKL